MPKSDCASNGSTDRSKPTMPPTNRVTAMSRLNCDRLTFRPTRAVATACAVAPSSVCAIAWSGLGDSTAISSCLKIGRVSWRQCPSFIILHDAVMVGRCGRNPCEHSLDESSLVQSKNVNPLLYIREHGPDWYVVEGN